MDYGWRIAEIITDPEPTPFWRMLLQLNVKEVVGILPRRFTDWRQSRAEQPWDYVPLANYNRMIEEEGLKLVAIEDNPPMDGIRYGTREGEEELENVCKLIENMGRLGIGTWCYNWMASLGWLRTSTRLRGRGGAVVTGFDEKAVDSPPPPAGPVDSQTLWRTLKDFLESVIPVAESSGVRLAMHPDDPPVIPSIRGVARIMNDVSAFDRLLELVPSQFNGITLCQGNFTLMADDLPAAIRHFGMKKRVFFVHFRDVMGDATKFQETFIDEGKTDMAACIRAYRDIGFSGIMRCDHTPTLEGDAASVPGYSALGRLHAIGYIEGLRRAIYSEKE